MSLTGDASATMLLRGKINSLDAIVIDAYAIAVKNGFKGTEAEWLASLKGDKGDMPINGVDYFTDEECAKIEASARAYTDEKTAPATYNTYGTVKVRDKAGLRLSGVYMDDDGTLRLSSASESEIDELYSDTCAITPANLKYAVKKACEMEYATIDGAQWLAEEAEGNSKAYTDEKVGDIGAALDKLHAYAQALVNGGVAE